MRFCTYLIALTVGAGYLLFDPPAAHAQKGGNSGTIAKVDAKSSTVTIKMIMAKKKKRELVEREFILNDDAKVTIHDNGEKKTWTGKEALAKGLIKEGMVASFTPEGDLKLKELVLGEKKKGKK